MRLVTLFAAFLFASPVLAQTPGTCETGSAEADLSISDVRARLFNAGNLFFGNTTVSGDGYLVPKASGISPLFAAGLWVGGLIDGDLRTAAATYYNFEFWPGPLEPGATLPDPNDCLPYDRFWLVDVFDVQRYEETGEASAALAEWPAELGAPVVDGDGVEGNYDLEAGDRPAVYGHQTAFWVMNDVGNEHENTLTEPIGLEVRVTAFASVEADLRQQTVYRYELVNRNAEPFEAAHFALFVDPDLGNASDDFVGVDSTRGMAFVYNGDDTDTVYGTPPAAGYDFLSGAATSSYFGGGPGTPTEDPITAGEIYNRMQGVWNDGIPFTEGGDGYMTGGDTLTWTFPGDPVTEQFWSEVNIDGEGSDDPPGDRRNFIASPAFTLEPGGLRAFDFAILFAQGADRFDSVAELYAVSDAVQFRYDSGALFAPGPQPPSGTLPAPEILAPGDGTTIFDADVELTWAAVPGAEQYRVEVAPDPTFYDTQVLYTEGPGVLFTRGAVNEVVTYHWRVKAIGFGLTSSAPSAARSFTLYRYEFDFLGDGDGIVETAYPGTDVCPDEDDPGCDAYGGNTVWLDPNATDDYLLASGSFLDNLVDPDLIDGEDFEFRFTDACAGFGGCLGAYIRDDGEIVSVPFELWNIGDEEDPSDDVRMIPLVRTNDNNPLTDWADTFTDTDVIRVGEADVELSVTDRVFFMMPDRPNGYALFEAAANGFGGPGAVYDPETDGDDQIDLNANGDECARQGWYVDFCYRDVPPFRAPIGGVGGAGLQVADLAGDGTTPPAGTTVRFVTNDRLLVDAEDDAPAAPQAFHLEAVYPNPFRSGATVAYRLDAAADVQLAIYDVLGRRVRVLHEGLAVAGAHRMRFDGSGLASGVYFVVLEADGRQQARKVMLVR